MNLKKYLEKKDLSVMAFANQLGRPRNTVYRYLDGSRIPRPKMMGVIEKMTKGAVTPADWVQMAQKQ